MNKIEYLEITWNQYFSSEFKEILVSILLNYGFDSFYESDTFFKAYIPKNDFNQIELKDYLNTIDSDYKLHEFNIEQLENKNWNEEWESNFPAVKISDKLIIRASFHDYDPTVEQEIIINPKMSFGTGHHETTSGMLEMMMELDFKDKNVIDIGCGTGVLAIYASMQGAKKVTAIDNDAICVENTIENNNLNSIENIDVYLNDVSALTDLKADIILANINRNILLNDIKHYNNSLINDSILMMSGFYNSDLSLIDEECNNYGLKRQKTIEKNTWIIALYKKN